MRNLTNWLLLVICLLIAVIAIHEYKTKTPRVKDRFKSASDDNMLMIDTGSGQYCTSFSHDLISKMIASSADQYDDATRTYKSYLRFPECAKIR